MNKSFFVGGDFVSPKRKRGIRLRPLLALRANTIVISLLAMLLCTSSTRAALDPETKKPYQLQIVLHVAANRVFTPLFQEQLQRDLSNQLKLVFGDLARIDVVRAHPLLREIETNGLDQALEGWDELSEHATHFVLLDYAAGTYRIQARFHDGMTGQPGPFTQRTQTNDRAAVAAKIAHLVETSFSPVGTVTSVGKEVTLRLKGGDLGVPLDRWVQPGQVFAVSRITKEGTRTRAQRLEWALLEVLDAPLAGVCRCRYWHRYQEDALRETAGTLGYRALRLPTTEGPVKVQLLDNTTLQPLRDVRVRVLKPGGGKPVELLTNRDGLALTREPFAHLAMVQVLSGQAVRAQFPVALIEGRTVVARVKIQADNESLAPLEVRRDAWLRRVYDNVRMSSERTLDLSLQLNQSLGAALDSGRKLLPLLDEELKYLESEQDDIKQLAKEKKLAFQFREGEQQIKALRKQAKELHAFVERVEAVQKETGDEKSLGLFKLLEHARLHERQAEFGLAIRLYEQVLQASPDQAKIRAHLEKLKLAWAPTSKEHAAAQNIINKTWPTIEVGELPEKLEQANEAYWPNARAADDRLTPQKLLRVNIVHMANLKNQLETLKRKDSEDNRNRAKTLVQISEALLRLHSETAAFLDLRKD